MYKSRIADNMLKEQLQAAEVVVVEGPKWCGKTTTAEQVVGSVLYLDNPQKRKDYSLLAENNPSVLLEGETPRLLDEWQLAPQLWDAARIVVDRRKDRGQFIFTGSAALPTKVRLVILVSDVSHG